MSEFLFLAMSALVAFGFILASKKRETKPATSVQQAEPARITLSANGRRAEFTARSGRKLVADIVGYSTEKGYALRRRGHRNAAVMYRRAAA